MEELDRRRAKAVEEREQAELKEVRASPQISKSASNGRRDRSFADYSLAWRKQSEARLERQRQQEEAAETKNKEAMKLISKRSEQIIARKGHAGPVDNWERRFEQFARKREEPPPQPMFQPQLDERAATLHRDTSVFERLYDLRKTDSLFDTFSESAMSEEYTFKPEIIPAADSDTGSTRDVHSVLYTDAMDHQARRERAAELQSGDATFQPQLNPRSRELAEKVPRRSVLEAGSPVLAPRHHTDKDGLTPATTPAPVPRLTSVEEEVYQMTPSQKAQDFLERNAKITQQYQQRLVQNKKSTQRAQHAECTFSPAVLRRSPPNRGARPQTAGSLYERTKIEQARKAEDMALARKLREEQLMRDCTFTPMRQSGQGPAGPITPRAYVPSTPTTPASARTASATTGGSYSERSRRLTPKMLQTEMERERIVARWGEQKQRFAERQDELQHYQDQQIARQQLRKDEAQRQRYDQHNSSGTLTDSPSDDVAVLERYLLSGGLVSAADRIRSAAAAATATALMDVDDDASSASTTLSPNALLPVYTPIDSPLAPAFSPPVSSSTAAAAAAGGADSILELESDVMTMLAEWRAEANPQL
eukprot:TRINITY_DN8671_c0_g1_i1.p1 TRINITY_DN8671_c0_g1~~TRINITY_DN8671_c0_g1_i1.p1  ORF type:complete len:625 (-),score=142.88 TRINITY_DN8671_c0_g1_i1:39-1817(-)